MENNVVDLNQFKLEKGPTTERAVTVENPGKTLQAIANFAAGLQLAASEVHEAHTPATPLSDENRRLADFLDDIAHDINRILTTPADDQC